MPWPPPCAHFRSVRGRKDGTKTKQSHEEDINHGIDVVGDFKEYLARESGTGSRVTWIAVKLTNFLPHAESLRNFSMHLVPRPQLSEPPEPHPSDHAILDRQPCLHARCLLMGEDVRDLQELYADLKRICMRANEQRN
ncbi:hypothetical protein EDC04DRAFT_2039560 [Pisolithus marmoratus]|nr:hypothetical protein EDC04DRAFT_2039560 [Pisolithus marmoratus]